MRNDLVLLFFLFSVTVGELVNSTYEVTTQPQNDPTSDDFKVLTKKLKKFMSDLVKILPFDWTSLLDLNITGTCKKNLISLGMGLNQLKPWAVAMFDATGKPKSGLLGATAHFTGAYDQCLAIQAFKDKSASKKPMFLGKYCSVQIRPPLPPEKFVNQFIDALHPQLKWQADFYAVLNTTFQDPYMSKLAVLTVGVCVPSTCSKDDIASLAAFVGQEFKLESNVSFCDVKGEKAFITPVQFCIIGLFLSLAALVIFATIADLWTAKNSSKGFYFKIFLCFSASSNSRKICGGSSSEELKCLHGIRVLSMTWVILGHTFIFHSFFSDEFVKYFYMKESFAATMVLFATISMYTFFFIGGLLVTYVTIQAVNIKKNKFNLTTYVLHRFIRLSPTYYMIIAFTLLLPLLISGPFVHSFHFYMSESRKHLWRSVFYVANYFSPLENGIPHGWYLCVDVQLYLASAIVLWTLTKWPKFGLAMNFVLIVCSCLVVGCLTYVKETPAASMTTRSMEQGYSFLQYIYLMPYTYYSSYGIGIFSGFILATRPKLNFPIVAQIFGWIVCCGSSLAVLFSLYKWGYEDPNIRINSAIYTSLDGVGWSLGVFWVVLICSYGHAGWVNRFLSWRAWIPLSHLTYTAYLVHPYVMILYVGNLRQTVSSSSLPMVWLYLGDVIVSYAVGYFLSLLVESPFISMEKLIFMPMISKEKVAKKDSIQTIAVKIIKNGSDYEQTTTRNGVQ